LNNGRDRGGRSGDGGIIDPTVVKGARSGAVTFSGKVQIDVCLPGQDCSFVTLEVVWAHVRMEVTPVVVGGGRVVTSFVWGVILITDGPNVGSNRWSLDTGKTGHTSELLPRRGFGGLELTVDVVGGRGGKWEGRIV
jgi:hypothetical protein